MKKITLLLTMAVFAASAFAQVLTIKVNGADANGATVIASGPIDENNSSLKCYFDVTNTSSSPITLMGNKQQIKIQEGLFSTFCWGTCIDGDEFGPVELAAQASSGKNFYGDIAPSVDFDIETLDTTIVKYKVWVQSNPADSVTVTVKYVLDKSVSIDVQKPKVTTKKTQVTAYSVAGSGIINFKYDLANLKSGNLVLRNLNGVVVSSQKVLGGNSSSSMNIGNLARGLYFYTIDNGGHILHAGKIIVN